MEEPMQHKLDCSSWTKITDLDCMREKQWQVNKHCHEVIWQLEGKDISATSGENIP